MKKSVLKFIFTSLIICFLVSCGDDSSGKKGSGSLLDGDIPSDSDFSESDNDKLSGDFDNISGDVDEILGDVDEFSDGENPEVSKCYTPCKSDFIKSDGKFIKCSSEGLMAGCYFGTVCLEGSCVAPVSRAAFYEDVKTGDCKKDSDCPDFQACLDGKCQSNCEKDGDCDAGTICHRKVCREACSNAGKSCEKDFFCKTTDGSQGICMPLAESDAPAEADAGGVFRLGKDMISMTNVKTESSFTIINESKVGREFVVKKEEHSYDGENSVVVVKTNSMKWIKIGEKGSESIQDQFKIFVEAEKSVEIGIVDDGSGELKRWSGVLSVSNEKLGTQNVKLVYASVPEGQWSGKMYYFANFSDKDLFQYGAGTKNGWFYNKNDTGATLNMVKNAFIQVWGNFRNGKVSFNEMNAAMQAMITGSWSWKSVMNICPNNSKSACYLYDNAKGYNTFTDDRFVNPIPSGLAELPIAFNLKKGDTDTIFTGRVDTKQALQYFGNPAVKIEYTSDPADGGNCSAYDQSGHCLVHIKSLDFTSYVGGRYATTNDDTSCSKGLSGEFKHFRIPWLVKGFVKNSYEEAGSIYKYECRQKTIPLSSGSAQNIEINANVASSNPVPDGGYRERKVEIIDGVIVDQESIIILFKESFDSFLDGDGAGFSSYGVIQLRKSSANLKTADFEGESSKPAAKFTGKVLNSVCSGAITSKIGTINSANAEAMMTTLIDGVAVLDNSKIIGINGNTEKAYYLCNDTGLFNGAKFNGEIVPCPDSSMVTYFILGYDKNLAQHECNNTYEEADYGEITKKGSCETILNDYIEGKKFGIRTEPVWRCKEADKVFCDLDREDLTSEKYFYQEVENAPKFIPIEASVANAFKYKTRFQARSGKNIGFAPEICEAQSDLVPYCYNPENIEESEERTDCLLSIYGNYYENLSQTGKTKLVNYLKTSFAYNEFRDGYERLNSELLIMLGDEEYTKSFASRFDLAGSNMKTFEGSLFEPNGIDLSGGAGFEMYSLYKAAQYYQKALDRFYTISPIVWNSIKNGGDDNFITQETVVSYFSKLIRASAQKSRAWSEAAKKYQSFNRPDLARLVVERAYTAAYLESIIISRMMLKTIEVADTKKRDQIRKSIDDAQLLFKAALIDMRDVYSEISDDATLLGFAPDYIPFPAMDKGDVNAFYKLFTAAQKKIDFARIKEKEALASNRAYETDAASFQSELVKVKNNYENQLAEICGTMTGDDGKIYPAIPKYAYLNKRARLIGNPCGLAGNGLIYEAMGEMELELYSFQAARGDVKTHLNKIEIEVERHNKFCELNQTIADYNFEVDGQILGLDAGINSSQLLLNTADRVYEWGKTTAELTKCSVIAGTSAGGDCPMAVAAVAGFQTCAAIYQGISVALEASIVGMEAAKSAVERGRAKWNTQKQCDLDAIESTAKIKEIALEQFDVSIETAKIGYRLAIAGSKIEKLQNEAKRIMVQQEESEQLLINVEAAKNDPNVRIYKNDAIINADKTFNSALQAAYKATKVFEYYTSQSYEKLSNLFLIRMISYGDYNLENYMAELQDSFEEFQENYGNPDTRLAIVSLRDDIMQIPRIDENGLSISEAERSLLFRQKMQSTEVIDSKGYISIPFNTNYSKLSPLTKNHKIKFIEAEIVGDDTGDPIGRIYLKQKGTGTVNILGGGKQYYKFPDRTAVIDTFFSGEKPSADMTLYRSERFTDRPYLNSHWEFIFNNLDEEVNKDINLNSLADIKIYVYYTDFTEL